MTMVRQPFCDERGVGFGARRLAENSTPRWSHQTILRGDETWLPGLGQPLSEASCKLLA
jgi:hypothetical protein